MSSLAEKIEALRKDVSVVLAEMKPLIDSAGRFRWDPSTMGYPPVIRRAMLCRQYECLECILHLVEQNRGYAGVPLLRPACEELIWAKYLALIDEVSTYNLLLCLAQKEMYDSLTAQDNYVGRAETKKCGLLDFLERLTKHQPKVRRMVKILGRRLHWPKNNIDAGTLPSIKWLAQRTGMRWVYDFVYHASSRYVHFSTAELLRRAWGTPDEVTIRSTNFDQYWSAFALVWGHKLLTETFLVLQKQLEADGVVDFEVDEDKIISAYQRIAEFGLVPIVTPAELHWPF